MYLKIISQSTPPTLQKAFFKHSLGCIKKTFSQSAHLTLWYIFLNLAAIVRYGNLILILVKVPQIVTYIL